MPSIKNPPVAKTAAPRKPGAAKRAGTVAASARPQATRPKAAPAAKPTKQKQKLVRDSFAMPAGDFGLIHLLKERALTFRRPAKKSELLRAGLHALAALSDSQLRTALDGLAPLKPGRPKNAA